MAQIHSFNSFVTLPLGYFSFIYMCIQPPTVSISISHSLHFTLQPQRLHLLNLLPLRSLYITHVPPRVSVLSLILQKAAVAPSRRDRRVQRLRCRQLVVLPLSVVFERRRHRRQPPRRFLCRPHVGLLHSATHDVVLGNCVQVRRALSEAAELPAPALRSQRLHVELELGAAVEERVPPGALVHLD